MKKNILLTLICLSVAFLTTQGESIPNDEYLKSLYKLACRNYNYSSAISEEDVLKLCQKTEALVRSNTVVDGSMKLASDEVQDLDERKEISQTLNKTSAKLMELINNILNLSRLEASMMKFQLGDIEIIPFVQGIVMLMRSREKEVELTLPETEKELKIYADVARLQEIFNNVLVTDKRSLKLFMRILEDGMSLEIKIVGSILADNKESLQEITIANEVNRLLAEYFGGQYSIKTDEDSSASAVYLILPLV